MARRVKDTTLDNRTARLKLTPRPEPYWKTVERGTHLGYRAGPSTWIMRTYSEGYTFKRIGLADDHAEANGVSVLDFWQAVAAVRHRIATLGTPVPGIETTASTEVREALASYKENLAARGGDTSSVDRVTLHLPNRLASKEIGLLVAGELKKWSNGLRSTLSVGSINRICNSLRAALNAVADSDPKVSRHAWEVGLKLLNDGEVQARNVILPEGQIRQIVAASYAINDAFGLLVEVAAVTGARVGQLARLTVGDVQATRLMVPPSRKGSGKKVSQTPVVIPASLTLRLKAAAKGRATHDLLLTKASGKPWGKSEHGGTFARAVTKAGLDPTIVTAYSLRHSSIVRQLKANVPIRIVAATHDTSILMIERHYSKEIASVSDDLTRPTLIDFDVVPEKVTSLR